MRSDDLAATLPDPGAVLIAGEPLTGKYELLIDLIADIADGVILVSTKYVTDRVIRDLRASGFGADRPVGIVDCVAADLNDGGVDQPAGEHAGDLDLVERVDGPENLTQIGVKFSELAEAVSDRCDGGRVVVGLHSLAQLAVCTDVEATYQFLQIVTGHVRTAGWLGVAVLDEPAATDGDGSVLKHHFDSLVETGESDGHRQYRVRGPEETTPWVSF